MISRMSRLGNWAAVALIAGIGAVPLAAQEVSDNRVGADTDWSHYSETGPRECWAVSAPRETVNTRDGQVVSVRRGEILLMVFYRPDNGPNPQIAFTGGYPFASGSTADMTIAGNTFQLYTEGEWAWPATAQDDAQIVAAMKAGSEAVIVARSGRGTTTRDTFSLYGFTAMNDAARDECAG